MLCDAGRTLKMSCRSSRPHHQPCATDVPQRLTRTVVHAAADRPQAQQQPEGQQPHGEELTKLRAENERMASQVQILTLDGHVANYESCLGQSRIRPNMLE